MFRAGGMDSGLAAAAPRNAIEISSPRPRQPGFAAGSRQRPHPADIGGAFGDADDAARVEQVEQMARLQTLVIGRQRDAARRSAPAFRLGVARNAGTGAGIGELEIEGREFALGPLEDIAIGDAPVAGRR